MTVLPNYDYDTENQQLDQKAKILLALQQGAMSDPSQGLAAGVRLSPLSPLIKIAQAYMASKGMDALNDQRSQLTSRYKADSQSQLGDFIKGISTMPGQVDPGVQVPGTQAPGQQGAPEGNNPSAFVPATTVSAQDAQKAKIGAIANAMTSNHPVMQALAQGQLSKMLTANQLDYKTMFESADGPTQQWMISNPGAIPPSWKPKTEVIMGKAGEMPINKNSGQIVNPGATAGSAPGGAPGGGMPAGLGGAANPANGPLPDGWKLLGSQNGIDTVQDSKGNLYQRSPYGLDQIDKAQRITVHNVINEGETSFAKTLGEGNAKAVLAVRDAAQQAQQTLPILDKLDALNRSGTYNGPTASTTVFLGQLAQTAGIAVDNQKLNNSQEYQQTIAKQVADKITAGGGVGRSFSDADREAYTKAFPTLTNTPEGRARIINDIRQNMHNVLQQNQRVTQELGKKYPALAPLDSTNPSVSATFPNVTTPTPGGPTVSNWPGSK